LVGQWLAGVAVLALLDLLFGLPVWLRWIALVVQAGWALRGIGSILLNDIERVSEDRAARTIEERHPELDNALIHAVQFERAASQEDRLWAGLIGREMERAQRLAGDIPPEYRSERLDERAVRLRAAALLAGWALATAVAPGIVSVVIPRLYLPWRDSNTPPYSLTRFEVRPGATSIPASDGLTITARVTGLRTDNPALLVHGDGRAWQRIGLMEDAPDTYSVRLDPLRSNAEFYVEGSTGRSPIYRIAVTRPPVVRSIHVASVGPGPGDGSEAIRFGSGEALHGPDGAEMDLEIESDRALRSGELIVDTQDGQPIRVPLLIHLRSTARATGRITLTRPGTLRVLLTATDGQVNPNAAHGPIRIDADGRLSVRMDLPARDLLVTPDMSVPVQIAASSDAGVREVAFHYSVGSGADTARSFRNKAPARKVGRGIRLDLRALGVRVGDRVTCYASAGDGSPGSAGGAQSPRYTLQVVTPKSFLVALKRQRQASDLGQEMRVVIGSLHELARQEAQIARQASLTGSGAVREAGKAPTKERPAAEARAQAALLKQARGFARSLQEYDRAPSGTSFEGALKQQLAPVSTQLNAVVEAAPQPAGQSGPGEMTADPRAVAPIFSRLTDQAIRTIQSPIQRLWEVLPSYNDVDRFITLLWRQERLARAAGRFPQRTAPDSPERSRLNELADEQSLIAHALAQVRQDLIDHSVVTEPHFPRSAVFARAVATAIDERRIVERMEMGRDRLRQWDGPQGYVSAANALLQMRGLVKLCHSAQARMRAELDVALEKPMGAKRLGGSLGPLSRSLEADIPDRDTDMVEMGAPTAYVPHLQAVERGATIRPSTKVRALSQRLSGGAGSS
jgi:hypothetical protein